MDIYLDGFARIYKKEPLVTVNNVTLRGVIV